MIFKSSKIQAEFQQLQGMNNRLYQLLQVLTTFTNLEFNKSITITSIHRTADEHRALYRGIDSAPASSPHMFWEAADIRSTDFTTVQVDRMLKFLNEFRFRNGKPVAICHTVGNNGEHFHIQYSKPI